jgi:hypothetical protein
MSQTGNPNGGPSGFQPRGNNFPYAQQQPNPGPARDAWNNPIKTEPRKNTEDQNDQKNRNDDGVNDDTVDNIWEDIRKKEDEDGGAPPVQPTAPVDTKKQMDDYLRGVGLSPIELTDQMKEQISNGDFSGILAEINQRTIQAHVKALSGAKTMIDEAVQKAVTEAKQGARDDYLGQMNLQALNNTLPWTKDKAIAPVARTIMQRFLNRGASTEDAIEGVKRYFDHASTVSSAERVNKNRNTNYGGGPRDDSTKGSRGWLDILSPES